MLLRISLILAILAGLGAGGVAYYEFSTQIPALSKQRDDEKEAKNTEITAHNKTKTELKKTQLTKTQALADAQQKRADDLSVKLTKTTSDLQDAQNQLAEYKASDLTPEQVVALNKDYKNALVKLAAINAENTVLNRHVIALTAELEKFRGNDATVKLRSDLKGKVVVVDPKWDFVVLDIGGDQGAVSEGEMLVSRDGRLVAKVIIRNVQKDRCIANIVPGWKLGEVIEGDVVTPAHPANNI
jgi:hypothetical protein